MKPKNTICLWFNKDAQDAARFYAATFPDSKVTAVHEAPGDYPGGKKGDGFGKGKGAPSALVRAVDDLQLPETKREAVVAAVVPRHGVSLTEDDIVAHCREHLAGFKTPKQVFFVDALPKNPSGKLLKRALRERFSLEFTSH